MIAPVAGASTRILVPPGDSRSRVKVGTDTNVAVSGASNDQNVIASPLIHAWTRRVGRLVVVRHAVVLRGIGLW